MAAQQAAAHIHAIALYVEGLGEEVCEALAKDVVFPKRLGDPNEFAEYASQIVQNTYINGSVMRLDGGIRLA